MYDLLAEKKMEKNECIYLDTAFLDKRCMCEECCEMWKVAGLISKMGLEKNLGEDEFKIYINEFLMTYSKIWSVRRLSFLKKELNTMYSTCLKYPHPKISYV